MDMADLDVAAASSSRILTITRTFDAPRELVWRAWTEPEHFMKWWGPEIFTSPSCEMDIRVGGKFLWCMEWPDGRRNYTTGEFREVVPLERLMYTTSFADADGNAVPPAYYGMGDGVAFEMQVTVVFEEHDGKTTIDLTHVGHPAELSEMARQGWNESLDKLAVSLR
jgi:uncharacterized protein YndB with AHSA1/START domain